MLRIPPSRIDLKREHLVEYERIRATWTTESNTKNTDTEGLPSKTIHNNRDVIRTRIGIVNNKTSK